MLQHAYHAQPERKYQAHSLAVNAPAVGSPLVETVHVLDAQPDLLQQSQALPVVSSVQQDFILEKPISDALAAFLVVFQE